ncbi:MAG TPA: glycosyltransferase family 39 protein [Gammaproteobacteria bacterium]|nr:glycosyltransferase family 39 protein [Gammaproteobacteria bacterium]
MTSTTRPVFNQFCEFKSHRLPILILLFLCFWSFFYNTGAIEMDLMEARNLVTAREIISNDNWLVPTMNGDVRLAKPPLPTWFAALVSLTAGGTDDLTLLRIPNAIAATLLILFTYGLCWTMSHDRRWALIAAVLLATNVLMIRMGQRATWDIFCHSFMLGALWAFVDGVRNNRGWSSFAVCGTLMGLSFMSKGPVSFYALLLPFAISYLWVFKPAEAASKWPLIVLAFTLCIVISSLWPLYIWEFHPEALLSTMDEETDAWANRHLKPFWYYLKFPAYAGIWLVITLAALFKPFAEKRLKALRNYRFLLLWLVLQVLLLSLIPEKKGRYLLPVMIPLAMLGGVLFREIMERFDQGIQAKGDQWIIALHTSLVSITAIIFPLVLLYHLDQRDMAVSVFFKLAISAVYLFIVAAAWFLFARKNLPGLFLLTALQAASISMFFMDSYRVVGISNPEYKRMTQIESSMLPPDIRVVLMENRSGIEFVWDLNRPLHVLPVEQIIELLESDATIAVISTGSPADELARKVDGVLTVTTIGRFDYNEDRAKKTKIHLSLVSLQK